MYLHQFATELDFLGVNHHPEIVGWVRGVTKNAQNHVYKYRIIKCSLGYKGSYSGFAQDADTS
jgi:hypothetical protein